MPVILVCPPLCSSNVQVNLLSHVKHCTPNSHCALNINAIFSQYSQKYIFKTFAFHTFPFPTISTLACWWDFHSRDFNVSAALADLGESFFLALKFLFGDISVLK